MEEYFYELSLLQTVTNTSNKVISIVKTIVSCICIPHTNSHTWCFSIFWAQWITAECLNCYRAPHFYFINLHLRKNCSLLTITSIGHCSKTERFSWIQCDCMSLPVAFLRLKTRIDWGKGPFIVKLKHYISNWKVEACKCFYNNRNKVAVVHVPTKVLKVLYRQHYLRQPTSQSQKLNSVQTLLRYSFTNYKCKQQKLQFWKEPVSVRGNSYPSGGDTCHDNVFRGTHIWKQCSRRDISVL